jgi:hypothetical protein
MVIYIIGGTPKKIHLVRHREEVSCPVEKLVTNAARTTTAVVVRIMETQVHCVDKMAEF